MLRPGGPVVEEKGAKMIIPIGHENQEVRRLPWVTFVIMGICVLVHLLLSGAVDRAEKKAQERLQEMLEFYIEHPYLEMDEETGKLLFPSEESKEYFLAAYSQNREAEPDEYELSDQQEEFDLLLQDFKDSYKDMPYMKYGMIPAKMSFFTLITSMFVHGGWLHLIGNLLYLYLSGPFVEDTWGRFIYGGMYIVTGIFSALMFAAHYPDFTGPLIGASGAISGVLGAFLVRHWRTRIKFFFMLTLLFRGTFHAPAWVMIPISFAIDFLNARVMDSINPEGGGGTAYWAHVWGFALGVAIALAIKYFKIEEKYIAPKIEAETTYVNKSYSLYEEAIQLKEDGRDDAAYAKLLEAVREGAKDPEVIGALWFSAQERDSIQDAVPYMTRMIETELRQQQFNEAHKHYHALMEAAPDVRLNPLTQLLLVEYLGRTGSSEDRQEAIGMFQNLAGAVDMSTPVGYLLQYTAAALVLDVELAKKFVELCNKHPEVPNEKKDELKMRLKEEELREIQRKASGLETGMEVGIDTGTDTGMGAGMGMAVGATAAGAAMGASLIDNPAQPQMQKPPPIPPQQATQIPKPPPIPEVEMIPSPPSPQMPPPPPRQTVPTPSPPPIPPQQTMPSTAFSQWPQAKPSGIVPPPIPPSPPPRQPIRLGITRAIPTGITADRIALNVEKMGARNMPLSAIKAISVAQITNQGSQRFLLIDLFLDNPAAGATAIRTVRLFSLHFNPQKFFPNAANLLEAYKRFLGGILQVSGAHPLPNRDAVLLTHVKNYPTIKDYESDFIRLQGS